MCEAFKIEKTFWMPEQKIESVENRLLGESGNSNLLDLKALSKKSFINFC